MVLLTPVDNHVRARRRVEASQHSLNGGKPSGGHCKGREQGSHGGNEDESCLFFPEFERLLTVCSCEPAIVGYMDDFILSRLSLHLPLARSSSPLSRQEDVTRQTAAT